MRRVVIPGVVVAALMAGACGPECVSNADCEAGDLCIDEACIPEDAGEGEGEGEGEEGEGEGEGEGDGRPIVTVDGLVVDLATGGVTQGATVAIQAAAPCTLGAITGVEGNVVTGTSVTIAQTGDPICAASTTVNVAHVTVSLPPSGELADGTIAFDTPLTDLVVVAEHCTAGAPVGGQVGDKVSGHVSCAPDAGYLGPAPTDSIPLTLLITALPAPAAQSAGSVNAAGLLVPARQTVSVTVSATADCSANGATAGTVEADTATELGLAQALSASGTVSVTCSAGVASATTSTPLTVLPELHRLVDAREVPEPDPRDQTGVDLLFLATGVVADCPVVTVPSTDPPDLVASVASGLQVVAKFHPFEVDTRTLSTTCGASNTVTTNVQFGSVTASTLTDTTEVVVGGLTISGQSGAYERRSLQFVSGLVEVVSNAAPVFVADLGGLVRANGGVVIGAENRANTSTTFALTLTSLRSVSGALSVSNNTNLATLTMTNLQSVSGALSLKGNSALTDANLPKLCAITGDLIVGGGVASERNGQLDDFILCSAPGTLAIDGEIFVGNLSTALTCTELAPVCAAATAGVTVAGDNGSGANDADCCN